MVQLDLDGNSSLTAEGQPRHDRSSENGKRRKKGETAKEAKGLFSR